MIRTAAAAFAAAFVSTAAAAEIQTRIVTFENAGATLSGTLFLPENHDGAALPAVVVTGAWTTVEEQMPKTYAAEMASRGFAAFTFDFRGWGKSGDLPGAMRYKEDPQAKVADIRAAVAHLATLPEIDASRLHGLGICASAGYMVDAAAGNPMIARVGLIAPWLQNAEIVDAVYGGPEGVEGLIAVSRAAQQSGTDIIPAAGPVGAEGVLMPFGGYYYEAERGAIPAYDNKWNQASWEGWLAYHPADDAARLSQPIAIVHSEAAAIPQGVKAFLQSYVGEATTTWLEDVAQFDFYDDPAHVTRAADAVADHFRAAPTL